MSPTNTEHLHELSVDEQQKHEAARKAAKKSEAKNEFTLLIAELRRQELETLRQQAESEVRYHDSESAVQAMKEMMKSRAAAWFKEDGEEDDAAAARSEDDEFKRFWAGMAWREEKLDAQYRERKTVEKAEEEARVAAGVKQGEREGEHG